MYLAAIADAQPQPPAATLTSGAMTPQAMAPNPSSMQPPPSYFMQQHQAVGMAQQIPPGIFPPRGPLQFGSPHQFLDPQQQLHQQAMQGHMGIRPMGLNNNNGLQHQMHHHETALAANNGNIWFYSSLELIITLLIFTFFLYQKRVLTMLVEEVNRMGPI
jgi:hypothetical protein